MRIPIVLLAALVRHRRSSGFAAGGQASGGYEIIRVPPKGGRSDGSYEDFVTGFVTPEGRV